MVFLGLVLLRDLVPKSLKICLHVVILEICSVGGFFWFRMWGLLRTESSVTTRLYRMTNVWYFSAKWAIWDTNQDLPQHFTASSRALATILEWWVVFPFSVSVLMLILLPALLPLCLWSYFSYSRQTGCQVYGHKGPASAIPQIHSVSIF
jgi:hypothetical protein